MVLFCCGVVLATRGVLLSAVLGKLCGDFSDDEDGRMCTTDPELRDWLTIHAPWLDDIIAILYQETMTYGEFANKCIKNTKKAINVLIKGPEPICDSRGKPIKKIAAEIPPCDSPPAKVVEDVDECNKIPPPILTKNICEIEACLKDLGDSAYHNYMTARDACILYNKQVEESMMNFNMRKLKKLHHAKKERMGLVEEHVENGKCAIAKLDELSRYFECGVQATKEEIKNTKDMLKEYSTKVKAMRMKWQWENDRALAKDLQWAKVETLMEKFTQENIMMTQKLNYMSKKPILRGDPDLLLHHAKRYVEDLREQLSDASAGMTDRVNRAVDTLAERGPGGEILDEKAEKDRQAQIEALYKKKFAEIEGDFKKRSDDHKASNEKNAKDAMQKLMDQSQKSLEFKVDQKAIEATKNLEKMVAAQVEIERRQMASEKAAMGLKLRVLQEKLDARLKAERETKRSQELWAAGYSLLVATKRGDPVVKVDKELKAIEKASGDGDKLVVSVLKAIPEAVRKKGIVPESVIRARYHVMEDVALKVALVEREGAPLPVYFLSFVQSLFLFMKIPGIPQKEFDKPPKEPCKDLDTFDLLQRARFWIERGDIAGALKYVNALEGASRAAATSWYDAARSLIETRQAAEAVIAHAAALGLQYV